MLTNFNRIKGFLLCTISILVLLTIAVPSPAQLLEGSSVYVWDFRTNDENKDEYLAYRLTEEFEEKLIQTRCFRVLERRNRGQIGSQRKLEKKIRGIRDFSLEDKKFFDELNADAVIFGEYSDDIKSGEFKINIVVEAFNGEKLSFESIRLRRGKIFDGGSRELSLQKLAKKLCPSGPKSSNQIVENIFVNYARLFGAYQVPFFLTGEGGYACEGLPIEFISKDGDQIDMAWRGWEYKYAKPIKSRVWDELFQCDKPRSRFNKTKISHILLEIANQSDPLAKQFYNYLADENKYQIVSQYRAKYISQTEVSEPTLDEHYILYEKALQNKYSAEQVLQRIKSNSANVGFLILYLENMGKKMLFDVRISYKEFVREGSSSTLTSASIVEKELQKAKSNTLILPRLKAGEQLLFLLAIYMKDQKGYPKSYISSVIRPMDISYRFRGSSQLLTEKIRLPLREKAMKIEIPFGWYQQ